MPKERKQRGRRKKKVEETEDEPPINAQSAQTNLDFQNHEQTEEDEHSANFFGLLDESEQTYFKTIDDAMIADEFEDTEQRDIFVENVFKEAEGKELKLATSPLGSKVLEQLLSRSKPEQVRDLFKKYQGNFHTLVRQRYASHVCEMLFAITATLIAKEMGNPATVAIEDDEESSEPYVSSENLFLFMLNEISSDISTLGADVYASHVVRDVLLILQGNLFTFEEAKGQAKRYHGQKKFSWARPDRVLPVPSSFKEALESLMRSLSTLPAPQLRMMAAQPYSVSFVQVLVAIEALSNSPQATSHPILFSLLGGEPLTEREDYIESIMREPSGSKLFETIIESVPSTHLKSFYEVYFNGRIGRFAHNPITNFVLQKLITTCMDPEIIKSIITELRPIFKDLVELNHLQIMQRLVEATLRLNLSPEPLFTAIKEAFDCNTPSAEPNLVSSILTTPVAATIEDSDRPPRRTDQAESPSADARLYNMQGVFLVKSLLQLPPPPHSLLVSCILATETETLLSYAQSHAAIKVLESFLLSPQLTLPHRKSLLNHFFGHFARLACDPTASHFVDLCWAQTAGLKLYKDRIAQELSQSADSLRGNFYGRLVWRNWHMDLHKNRRGEWHHLINQAQAKTLALARLDHRQPPSPVKSSRHPTTQRDHAEVLVVGQQQLGANGLSADRASMINRASKEEDEKSKRTKKKRRERREQETDEVDDIFKRRKL